MPLTKMTLTNFQKHQSLTVDFDPKMTTIVGESNAGKTAIIRALRFVIFNQPRGSLSLATEGKELLGVTLEFDEHVLERIRQTGMGGFNRYVLDGSEFSALGAAGSVPEPISNALNISPSSLQLQHDPPFWLFDSPSQFAKNLNSIIDLSEIDRLIDGANRHQRKIGSELSVAEERLQEIRQQIADQEWIVECHALWQDHQKAKETTEAKKQQFLRLRAKQQQYLQTDRQAEEEYLSEIRTILLPLEKQKRELRRKLDRLREKQRLLQPIPLLQQTTIVTYKKELGRMFYLNHGLEKLRYASYQLVELQREIISMKVRVKNSKEIIATDPLDTQYCPTCKREL